MQERYSIDLSEPGLLDARSARWLRTRILGLLSVPFRYEIASSGLFRFPTTRLQAVLFPPRLEKE